jgi:hypothetical protein
MDVQSAANVAVIAILIAANAQNAPSAADTKIVDNQAEAIVEAVVEARVENVRPERKTERKPQINAGNRNARSTPPPANDDSHERRQRYHRDHDDGPTPVGFGDDVPAFMLIGSNLAKA